MEGFLENLKNLYPKLQIPQKSIYMDIVEWLEENIETLETANNRDELGRLGYLLQDLVSNEKSIQFIHFLEENNKKFNEIFSVCKLNERQKHQVSLFQMRMKNAIEIFQSK